MTELSPEGGPDAQFAAHMAAGKFMIQRGVNSGTAVYPPVPTAPRTGEDLEWFEPSGKATVHSVTIMRKKPPTPSFAIALVDLDEGPRMMTRIDGVEQPEDVKIGMKVVAKVIEEDEQNLVVFVPEGAGA